MRAWKDGGCRQGIVAPPYVHCGSYCYGHRVPLEFSARRSSVSGCGYIHILYVCGCMGSNYQLCVNDLL